MIDPEDEAFNDIERMSRIRKESVRSSMLKPKTAEEFYSELLNKAREEVRKEPPKYSFKAHWEKDGRIGLVAAIVRSDGGVHILEDVIDVPQRTEQEPVQFKCTVIDDTHPNGIPLEQWAKPPQRTWVGLSDEEIAELHHEIKVRLMGTYKTEDIYRAIEAKLKEKNI